VPAATLRKISSFVKAGQKNLRLLLPVALGLVDLTYNRYDILLERAELKQRPIAA
jgi:hypothetical protein